MYQLTFAQMLGINQMSDINGVYLCVAAFLAGNAIYFVLKFVSNAWQNYQLKKAVK